MHYNSKENHDNSVTVMRCCATVMIVLCHLCTYLGFNFMGQVFMLGVQFFFFISGWLYHDKKIKDGKTWFVKQWIKICIPIYIWQIIMSVVGIRISYYSNIYDVSNMILVALFNLQGIYRILPGTKNLLKFFPGCAHLWFTTIILTCYLLLIFVKKLIVINKMNIVKFVIISSILLCLGAKIGICIEWWFIFLLGYYWACEKNITIKKYSLVTVCFVFSVIIYLLCWKFFDGTLLYDEMISYIANNMITLWCFETIRLVETKTEFIKIIAKSKLFKIIEQYSYEIYIVHYGCLYIAFAVLKMELYAQLITFMILTCISTAFLYKFSDFIKVKYIKR